MLRNGRHHEKLSDARADNSIILTVVRWKTISARESTSHNVHGRVIYNSNVSLRIVGGFARSLDIYFNRPLITFSLFRVSTCLFNR